MKLNQRQTIVTAVVLLGSMAAIMFNAASQDSATVDETTFLSAGYSYLTGYRYRFAPEHPPVSQTLPALPLLLMNIQYSDNARALLDGRASYPWTRPWFGPVRAWQEYFPHGRDNWYYWWLPESQLFGQMLVYDGTNDGNAMMFRGRCVQILLALGVGVIIFLWVSNLTGNSLAALAALAAWVFHPVALGYGHLITTDIGVTFGFAGAVVVFAKFLERPSYKLAGFAGVATGVALVMKLTAILLAPVFIVLALSRWKQLKPLGAKFWKTLAVMGGAVWVVLLVVYFPRWSPPPPLPEAQTTALGVPGWFRAFRPFLIPKDFFKALGLTLGHSKEGHDAFLLGQWSHEGWWYYYPLAFFFKSPVAFVGLVVASAITFVKHFTSAKLAEIAAWAGVVVFLIAAMSSNVNIGVRHLFPIFPLLCVGIGGAVPRLKPWLVGGLLAGQVVGTLLAYPLYIQFFSEAVGGAKNGHQYLIDSNYDWGQDANRLKQFLQARGIDRIYLDYFGTQYNIEYLKIPNTRVTAEQARQIKQGWLVVSASQLMRPEWSWLRESHQPVARVAHTLFVYQL